MVLPVGECEETAEDCGGPSAGSEGSPVTLCCPVDPALSFSQILVFMEV